MTYNNSSYNSSPYNGSGDGASSPYPPTTIWRDTSGLGDYSSGDPYYIVDPSDVYLVDPSGVFIIDTGVTRTGTPTTEWIEDDSI